MLDRFRKTLPRSLATSALLFGGVASSYATAGTANTMLIGINAFIGLIASLAGSVASTDIYKAIAEQINHEDVLANGDLSKAIADAICATIKSTADKPEHVRRKNEILSLTENTSTLLAKLLHGEVKTIAPSAQEEIRKLSSEDITDIFTADPRFFSSQKSKVSVKAWEEIVMWLASEKNAVMSHDTTRLIATDLRDHFSRVFLQVIKVDFRKDGYAYVALQHQINNRILAGQKEIFAAISGVSQQVADLQVKLETKLAYLPVEVAKEIEKTLHNYETYEETRRLYLNSQNELKVLRLKKFLQKNIFDVLNVDHRNTFFRKYVHSTIYLERKEPEYKFRDFLAQSQQRCFVVIGMAGMGKTCLLCKLAESLAIQDSKFLPLLISAESLRLTGKSAGELKLAIVERLQSAAPSVAEQNSFESFSQYLKDNGLNLVVLIDGLNELQGNDSYATFNTQFESLVELVLRNDLPIYFALTCRYEWWQYFSASQWVEEHIYDKNLAEQATVTLEPPSEKEVKQLSERYFDYFAIKGELTGEAVRTCQTLLMLRFLCDAYTHRPTNDKDSQPVNIEPYELKEVSSFKKKEILKRYVSSRREAFVEFVRNALYDVDPTPSNIYNLTTLYIINIANFMYRQRQTSVTADEVFRIAEDLRHPDATLGAERISSSSSSVFQRLIDLGIFSRSEKNAQEFSFVYETYFEFSLGRYLAFVRWRKLTNGKFEHGLIEEDLENLINEHAQLSDDGDFSNLFGAIQFAVLATEAGDWINWKELPSEERIYRKHPELFSQLIGCLADTKKGFDWLQQACATIREAELAKRETWNQFDAQSLDREKAREQFGELLKVLDKLAKTTDFVLLWDIENTLKTLARANFGLTLGQLKRWAESGDSLKTVFAAQVVSELALVNPQRVMQLLLEWMQNEKFRSNFWIIRSLLFAISEITRANYRRNLEDDPDWIRLRDEVYKLQNSNLQENAASYTSSRALSLLPNLSLSQDAELNRIDDFIDRRLNERDSWQLLNLVFNLAELPKDNHVLERWIFRTLNKIAEHPNHHLLYAIEKVLDSVGSHLNLSRETSAIKSEIENKLQDRRWKTYDEPRTVETKRNNQVGIVYTPKYLEPDYENHIECRERLLAILNKIEACGEENFTWIVPREAGQKELERVHNREFDRHRDGSKWHNYIETIKEASEQRIKNREHLERSGPSELRFESFEIAKMAAGGVIKGIDYVKDNDALAAFVLNRPPGHLANNTICIFNNIAVGARHALTERKVKRVLIVDCDAHHGQHTQQVFYRSSNVVYFSMHIDGDYARESGMITNAGEGEGKGYTFNIPYPPKMGDDGYEYIIDKLLLPVALDFKPELILVSAGFDGHFDDPLTPACLLSEQSYIHLARTLKNITGQLGCKIVGALEGGYGLNGMSNSLAQMLNVWGNWNLEAKIGYTQKPAGFSDRVNPKALDEVREIVAKRIEIMLETKRGNDSYFFNPAAEHWRSE